MLDFHIWVGIGASLGLWRLARSTGPGAGRWVNAGLFVLLLILVGARTSFVLQNLPYFTSHLVEIPMVWLGGLSWPGAVLGGLLALGLLVIDYRSPRTGRLSPGWLGDALYPLLPPLAVSIWLGCWQAGTGYGPPAPEGAWWGIWAPDETGVILLRWPLQPLAALSLLAYFALLERWVATDHRHGRLSSLAITGLLLHLLVFSELAADPSQDWYGLRANTWLAVAILLGFILVMLGYRLFARTKRRTRPRWLREAGGHQAN
jgi:prolipoprotein diacylglyceryltransferase